MLVDTDKKKGRAIAYRLQTEDVIWLTVVRPDGSPYPTPVWFLWEPDGDAVIIYSSPSAKKIQHLEKNPRVSLNFNSNYRGGDVVVITGTVSFEDVPSMADNPAYMEKYGTMIKIILNQTPAEFAAQFTSGYRVSFDHVAKHV